MTNFSQRFGYTGPTLDLGDEDMPETLKNGLWDAITLTFFQSNAEYNFIGQQERLTPQFSEITKLIWFNFFRKPIDTRAAEAKSALSQIRKFFFEADFFLVYDFLEFLAQCQIEHFRYDGGGKQFTKFCNTIFERERAAFRFADTQLVRISDPIELEEITIALTIDTAEAVRAHIRRATELYSERKNPDYRNSIKESISAVEAAVSFISGKKTSGISKPLQDALSETLLHPALRQGFEKLYSYTSDADGIRHALLDDGRTLTQEDARYMLVSCSAFANYLLALHARRQL